MDHEHSTSNAIGQDDVRADGYVARRTALMGFGALGAAGLLAACGDDGSGSGTATPSGAASPRAADEPSEAGEPSEGGEASETGQPSTSGEPGGGAAGEQAVATTSDVPVGGGVVVDAASMVVVQPAAGEFRAFSNICTHQGCSVTKVADGLIMCPCHGSRFSAADGSVQTGPATAPLPEVAITVDGTAIIKAG